MDTVRFKFHLEKDNFWSNLKYCLGILALNYFIISTLIVMAYCWFSQEEISSIISKYRKGYQNIFFASFKQNYFNVMWNNSLIPAVNEEVLFRGPIYIAIKQNFRLKIFRDITTVSLVLMMLISNYLWVSWPIGHPYNIPIFIAGLPWYWLIFKTHALWPSILCHFLANMSLYLFIQISLYFQII